jgi:hypothetical protein
MKGSPTLGLAANTNNQILTLRGVIAPDGSLHVDPLFRGPGSPAPSAADSRYQVVLLDAAGRQLASQPLALTTIAIEQIESGELGSGFRVSLPQVEGLASLQIYEDGELVFERHRTGEAPALGAKARSEGAGGEVQMSWSAGETDRELAYRLLFSPDGGANWQVLASKTAQPSVVVPPALLEGADHPLLQVQVSDGVQIAVTTISITELANSEPDSTR